MAATSTADSTADSTIGTTTALQNERDEEPIASSDQNGYSDEKVQKPKTMANLKRGARLLSLLSVAPYVVGIVWHAFHPFVSVFTGDAIARRWYIDENSLEPSYFRMDVKYDLAKPRRSRGDNLISLCASLKDAPFSNLARLPCYVHEDRLEIVKIVPIANAVVPVSEAIVLVVPGSKQWQEGTQVRNSLLQLISRLADPASAPWLAKTILLVSPVQRISTDKDIYSLSETVDYFLDCYLGTKQIGSSDLTLWDKVLPTDLTGAMIRNLLVVNVTTASGDRDDAELRILPQGRRGVLPNMDLVFCVMVLYSRSHLMARNSGGLILMHPYRQEVERLVKAAKPWLSRTWQSRARSLLQLLAFETTLVVGPTPPHAGALDRGIDALTIDVILQFNNIHHRVSKTKTAEVLQVLEYVVRALSNLHERLHHSTSLYLLPSSDRFVKHEEYLVPCLLLIVPLLVRAVALAFFDVPRFELAAMGRALLVTLGVTAFSAIGLDMVDRIDDSKWSNISDVAQARSLIIATVYFVLLGQGRLKLRERSSVQFVACFVAAVVHIPIAFGHVSLAFPSALLWTPLLGLPIPKQQKSQSFWRTVVGFIMAVLLFPSTALVPRLLPTYTAYVQFLYIPLHVLFCLLSLPSN